MLFYTVCRQYQCLLSVKSDTSLHAKFTPVEEYTLYIVNDYGLTYAMAGQSVDGKRSNVIGCLLL